MGKAIKTREEIKTGILNIAQPAYDHDKNRDVITIEDAYTLIDDVFDSVEDYVILCTHEQRPYQHSPDISYAYFVVDLFSTKEMADRELLQNNSYEWRENSTGSMGWEVIKRSEVPKEAQWNA